jgi:HEAT repeat protein
MRAFVLLIAIAGMLPAQTAVDTSWHTLDLALKDSNPTKRVAALTSMGVLKPETKPVGMVEALLSDKDFAIRQTACTTLSEMGSKASIPKLQAALDDKAPEVVFAAAKALYRLGDPEGRRVLEEVLMGDQKDASGFVTSSLHDAKSKIHDPRALLLIGVNQAAGFAGPFGAGLPVAEQLMKDGQASGKTVAALMLSTDTSPESKPAVKAALSDKNWTVRVAALHALAVRNLTEYFDDVTPLLDDKRDEVKYAAACAVIRLRQQPPKPAARAGGTKVTKK